MATRTLTYVLLGKDSLSPTFKKAGKQAEESSKGITGSFSKVGFAGVALAGVIGGYLVKALKDARAEGWTPLAVAAKNAGIQFDAFKPKAEQAGAAMAKFGFSQADVNSSLKILLTTTRNGKESLGALGTAADFAKYKGIGLSDAANLLAKAATGSTRALKDVGISTADLPKHFSSTGTEASRMTTIMGLLNKRVGGEAAASANTFGGKLAALHAQLENVSAKIGTALLPILSSLLTTVNAKVMPAINQFSDWFDKTGAPAIKAFSTAIQPLIQEVAKDFFNGIKAVFEILKPLSDLFIKLPGPIKVIALGVAGLTIAWLIFNKAVESNPFVAWAAIVILAIGLVVTHWQFFVNLYKTTTGEIKRLASDAWNAIGNTFKALWNDVLRPILKTWVDVWLNVFGTIIHGAAAAFGWIPGLGGKLKGAAKAFDQFKNDVNSALGNINDKTVNVSVAMKASTNPYPGGISGRKATGGRVYGPGSGTSDTAGLFALSNDEWVVRASSANMYGHAAMNAVNQGKAVIGFAGGGGVGVNVSTPSANSVGNTLWSSTVNLVKSSWQSVIGAMGAGGGYGGGVARWAGLVAQVLAMFGQPLSLVSTVLRRMSQESGGNPNAINLWDSNYAAGDPSRGLMQTIGSTFNSFAGPFASRGIYDPLANIYASFGYALSRYGSLSAAFNRPGGYAMGTNRANPGWAMVGERGPELLRFRGGESVTPNNQLGGTVNVYVNVKGALSTDRDIAQAVVDGVSNFQRHGGMVPWAK